MKYVILVSHGEFAPGLMQALSMLAGERSDLLAAGLKDGTSADDFAESFAKVLEPVGPEDEILLLGDLIGGSPLTTACNVISEKGFSKNTRVIGGMNLPVALSALLMKDTLNDPDLLVESILSEGQSALKEFKLVLVDEEDEI